MIISNNSIISGNNLIYVQNGLSRRAEKFLDEMAKGLRENIITDDLSEAKKLLAQWRRTYDSIVAEQIKVDTAHNQDLRSESELRKNINDMRRVGNSYLAEQMENYLKAQQIQTESHYQENQRLIEKSLDANAYVEILTLLVNDLNNAKKIAEGKKDEIKDTKDIDLFRDDTAKKIIEEEENELREQENKKIAQQREEIKEIENGFWQDAKKDDFNFGKFAFFSGLIVLGIVLIKGNKKSKKK